MKKNIIGTVVLSLFILCAFDRPGYDDKKHFTAQPIDASITIPDGVRSVGTIIIDAGHGGRDNGATATHIIDGKQVNVKEKEITLGIATILKEKLASLFPYTKIILTREDDVTVPLRDRMEPINPQRLDSNEMTLYISIHTNWSFDAKTRGYGFCINNSHPKNGESFQLSAAFGKEFSKAYKEHEIPNRGIINRRFLTSNDPYIPAVMLEMGNINNYEDAALLCADQGFERCAAALAGGIAAYMEAL